MERRIDETVISATNDEQLTEKKGSTTQKSVLALVLASTICDRYGVAGSLVKATSCRGVLTCCACCGLVCDEGKNKEIENKKLTVDKILTMEEVKTDGDNVDSMSFRCPIPLRKRDRTSKGQRTSGRD